MVNKQERIVKSFILSELVEKLDRLSNLRDELLEIIEPLKEDYPVDILISQLDDALITLNDDFVEELKNEISGE